MKILLVSLFLPLEKSYHAGGRHVFEIIRHLSERHEIHLVTRHEQGEEEGVEDLRRFCTAIHPYPYRRACRRTPFALFTLAMNYLGFSRFADRLVSSEEFDLVQVEWVETALLMRKHRTPMVLTAHDVITKPWKRRAAQAAGLRRHILRLAAAAVRGIELAVLRRFDRIMTMSEYDRDLLHSLDPDIKAAVVPVSAGSDFHGHDFTRAEMTILMLASFRYRSVNVEGALWFYREVLPLVRGEVPQARFVLAGAGPPPQLTRLAEEDPLTEVPGFVEDLEKCHKEAAIFVAPILTGGGIIVKVLDALAAGTPVVTTSYGNEGVGATPGKHLLVADSPHEFAGAVTRLLQDPEYAARLGESGRDFVLSRYGREAVMGRIDAVHVEVAASGALHMQAA